MGNLPLLLSDIVTIHSESPQAPHNCGFMRGFTAAILSDLVCDKKGQIIGLCLAQQLMAELEQNLLERGMQPGLKDSKKWRIYHWSSLHRRHVILQEGCL